MAPVKWLSPRDAAAYCSVDVVTLRRAVKRGTLKAFRIDGGRLLRYRVEDLDVWMSSVEVRS
jgi:excisionase family DNA binding protein